MPSSCRGHSDVGILARRLVEDLAALEQFWVHDLVSFLYSHYTFAPCLQFFATP